MQLRTQMISQYIWERKEDRHNILNSFVPTVPTFAVRETASLGQHVLEQWEQMS